MANIRLFSARACPFAHRTRLVLAEKKLAFELVEIDLQNKPSWFDSKISAYGKVPALSHDDVNIWESAVINEYVEEAFPAHPLLPRSVPARALARIFIDYANTRFSPAYTALLRGTSEDAQSELDAVLGFLEHEGFGKLAGDGPFFFGKTPGLVDFTFYPWFERWPALTHFRGFAIPKQYPRLLSWVAALSELDSVISQRSPSEFYIERYARYVKAA